MAFLVYHSVVSESSNGKLLSPPIDATDLFFFHLTLCNKTYDSLRLCSATKMYIQSVPLISQSPYICT